MAWPFRRGLTSAIESLATGDRAKSDLSPELPSVEERLVPISAFGGQRLILSSMGAAGYKLRDESDRQLVGRLGPTDVALAEAADGSWRLSIGRKRLGWWIVASTQEASEPAACYVPLWLRGGRVWLSPDNWGVLRPRLRIKRYWRLTIEGRTVARFYAGKRRSGVTLEVEIAPTDATSHGLSLLVLLGCWAVITDYIPNPGGGGGP